MNQNIKNFIEEGEKEFDKEIEKLDDIYYKSNDGYDALIEYLNSKDNLLCRDMAYPETQYELDPDKVKQFISSRQISLIKMIVEKWFELNLRYDNQENWDKELIKFGLYMQGLLELTDGK